MTEEEMSEEYVRNNVHYEVGKRENGTEYAKEVSSVTIKQAFLAGLKAGSENYSKIYMLGRKDERERSSALCKNPISICKRCDCHKTLCEGSDFGAYIGECESFVYKEVSE